jgi:hypothetical protein
MSTVFAPEMIPEQTKPNKKSQSVCVPDKPGRRYPSIGLEETETKKVP